MENKELNILLVLVSVFIGMLTISNVLAFKLIEISNLVAPAGVIAYAITYITTDVMVEMFGKEKMKFTIMFGFITQILVLVAIHIAVILPPASFFELQNEFGMVLSQSSRIIIASLTAYLFSQIWDIHIFSLIKKKTKGKHLWLRNNLSTMSSQLIDTFLFILIAFFGLPIEELFGLMVGQYVIKFFIAILDTPIVYLVVYGLKVRLGLKSYME